jgi:hypothetical protein
VVGLGMYYLRIQGNYCIPYVVVLVICLSRMDFGCSETGHLKGVFGTKRKPFILKLRMLQSEIHK